MCSLDVSPRPCAATWDGSRNSLWSQQISTKPGHWTARVDDILKYHTLKFFSNSVSIAYELPHRFLVCSQVKLFCLWLWDDASFLERCRFRILVTFSFYGLWFGFWIWHPHWSLQRGMEVSLETQQKKQEPRDQKSNEHSKICVDSISLQLDRWVWIWNTPLFCWCFQQTEARLGELWSHLVWKAAYSTSAGRLELFPTHSRKGGCTLVKLIIDQHFQKL